MLSWILAAIIGAVPLYFGVNHGRRQGGVKFWIHVGFLLSLCILGLMIATGAAGAPMVLPALFLAYMAGVGAMGMLAGGLLSLLLGRPD